MDMAKSLQVNKNKGGFIISNRIISDVSILIQVHVSDNRLVLARVVLDTKLEKNKRTHSSRAYLTHRQ